jgi:hypothetical protein
MEMSFRDLEQIKAPHTNDDWLQALEEHTVQFVVLSQSQDEKLVETLLHQTGWATDFEGDGVVIFARSAEKGKGQ